MAGNQLALWYPERKPELDAAATPDRKPLAHGDGHVGLADQKRTAEERDRNGTYIF